MCRIQGRSAGASSGRGVHGQVPAARSVGLAHHDLDPHGRGQRERRLDEQLLDVATSDLVGGVHGHLDERRAGHDRRAADDVPGQPRVERGRQPRAEQQPAVGQRHRRSHQRVAALGEQQRGRLGPVAPPLEGVGRQVDRPGPGEHLGPGDGPAGDVHAAGALDERPHLVGGPRERDPVVVALDALLSHGGQHRLGADLDEPGDALGLQPGDSLRRTRTASRACRTQ